MPADPNAAPDEPEDQLSDEEIERELEAEERAVKPRPKPHVQRQGQATFLDKAWDLQYRIENRLQRFGKGRYARVVKMARKPEPEEFARTSKITALGLFVIGLVGFLIFLLMKAVKALLEIK